MADTDEDLNEIFKRATEYVRGATAKFSSSDLLYLYARFKLVNEGPCSTPRPGFFDFQGRQKWDAWNKIGNTRKEDAMLEYVNKVLDIDPEWEDKIERGEVKAKSGLGVAVSTLHSVEFEFDPPLADNDKSIIDWCKEGNANHVQRLIQLAEPREVDQLDDNGLALLHWSCDRGHIDIVNMILDHGANINVQDSDGQTPLHYAISCEHVSIVDLLIRRGADTSITDSDGTSPRELARNSTVATVMGSS